MPDFDEDGWSTADVAKLMFVGVISIVVTVLTLVLRFVSRKLIRLPWLADDFVMLIAGAITIILAVMAIHFKSSVPDARTFVDQVPLYVFWQLEGVALTLIRVSVLLFYRRIFASSASPALRYWVYVLWFLVIGWFLGNNLTLTFVCTPINHLFDKSYDGPMKCISLHKLFISVQTLNIAIDIILLSVPMTAVYGLQVASLKKFGVATTFLLGYLSIAITIGRLIVFLIGLSKGTTSDFKDFAYWSVLEPAAQLSSACLPTMVPLLHIQRNLRDYRRGSKTALLSGSVGTYTPEPRQDYRTQPMYLSDAWRIPSEVSLEPFDHKAKAFNKPRFFPFRFGRT